MREPKDRDESWLQWSAAWILIVSSGAFVGLTLAFSVLWWQSHLQVRGWISDPQRTAPGVIWSAPIEVRIGQSATVPEIAGDLLAAGYSKLEPMPHDPKGVSPVGVFSIDENTLHIWTEAMAGPDFAVPEGTSEIVIEDGRIAEIGGGDVVVLRPTVLATIGDPQLRRGEVTLDALSPWVEKAVVAVEDERFRSHFGIDPFGVARAARQNLDAGDTLEGGSTLTQQLAKNLFLTPERTLRRKLREAVLALALEIHLSKDEILALYLGEVYYGQMAGLPLYGISDASRAWFGKEPKLLELHEAALLAAVIAAPNRYSPVRHPEPAKERRDLVLDRMVQLGYAEASAVAVAKEEPLALEGVEPSLVRRAPYAVDYAVDVAERELGDGALARNGYQVWTWIQPQLQRTAEEAVRDGLDEVGKMRSKAADAQAALVAVRNEDGGIVAMVGGRSYVASPFNRAVDARRQAGSTIKPLTLLAALDGRLVTLSDMLLDEPISRKAGGSTWRPRNYDGGYAGWVTVRTAIEHSRNIPAVLLAEKVGASRLQHIWQDLGLSAATPYPSAALGAFGVTPVEMAGAYTVFANGGVRQQPLIVRSITKANGEEVRRFGSDGKRIADPQATALAISVLEGVMRNGTGARAWRYGVEPPVGGKTGTTDNFRDAWFVGFTPELSVAVWVGMDTGDLGLPGSRGSLPTWARFMGRSGISGGEFPAPDGLVATTVCAESGEVARPTCPRTYTEEFVRGTQPASLCDLHVPKPRLDFWERIFGPQSDNSDAELERLQDREPEDGEYEPLYDPRDDGPVERARERIEEATEVPAGDPVEEPDTDRARGGDERPGSGRARTPRGPRVREAPDPDDTRIDERRRRLEEMERRLESDRERLERRREEREPALPEAE